MILHCAMLFLIFFFSAPAYKSEYKPEYPAASYKPASEYPTPSYKPAYNKPSYETYEDVI